MLRAPLELLLVVSTLILPAKSGLYVPEREHGLVPAHEVRAFNHRPVTRPKRRSAGGGLLTAVHQSSWANALGTTEAAIDDNNTWNGSPISADYNLIGEVIATTGLGFTAPRCLWVKGVSTRDGFLAVFRTGMPVPGVGTGRNYRWKIRVGHPDDLVDDEFHPIQDTEGLGASSTNWMFKVLTSIDGQWIPRIHCIGGTNTQWDGPALNKGHTYRVEKQLWRYSSTNFRVHMAIYNESNTQVAGDSSFSGGGSTLADNPVNTFNNVARLSGLIFGSNGVGPPGDPGALIGGGNAFPYTYQYYQSEVAVVDTLSEGQVIGPYPAVTGEA